MSLLALEWFGALAGLIGAFLLATNTKVSRWGWLCFLIANFAITGVAIANNLYGLMIQQIGFTATSLLGIYRSGLLNTIREQFRFKRKQPRERGRMYAQSQIAQYGRECVPRLYAEADNPFDKTDFERGICDVLFDLPTREI